MSCAHAVSLPSISFWAAISRPESSVSTRCSARTSSSRRASASWRCSAVRVALVSASENDERSLELGLAIGRLLLDQRVELFLGLEKSFVLGLALPHHRLS